MKKLLSSTKFQVGFTFFRRKKANTVQKSFLQFAKSSAGFTLIELLIVIVIIVIVVGVGAVSYTTVARNARDSQRKADLAKIAAALEQEYSDFGVYPAANFNNIPNTALACNNAGQPASVGGDATYYYITLVYRPKISNQHRKFACQDIFSGSINTYMEEVPIDPLNNNNVCSSCANDTHYYNYYSYLQDRTPCAYYSLSMCTYHFKADFSDYKPSAPKYKLVAIMENSNNATNAPGDQDPSICRKANYCYVVPSPNF